MTLVGVKHLFENSRLKSPYFTEEALTAAHDKILGALEKLMESARVCHMPDTGTHDRPKRICSACGYTMQYPVGMNYCPGCGAWIEEDEKPC